MYDINTFEKNSNREYCTHMDEYTYIYKCLS